MNSTTLRVTTTRTIGRGRKASAGSVHPMSIPPPIAEVPVAPTCDAQHTGLRRYCEALPVKVGLACLAVVYIALVAAELSRHETIDNDRWQNQLWLADLVICSMLLVDLLMRAVGTADSRTANMATLMLSGLVICFCLVMAMIEAFQNDAAVFRALRLFMIVHLLLVVRWCSTYAHVTYFHDHVILAPHYPPASRRPSSRLTSPLEECLNILHTLSSTSVLTSEHHAQLHFVRDMLQHGDLHQPMQAAQQAGAMDEQTAAWMENETAVSLGNVPTRTRRYSHGLSQASLIDENDDFFQDPCAQSDDSSTPPMTPVNRRASAESAPTAVTNHTSVERVRTIHAVRSMRLTQRQKMQSFDTQLRLMEFMSQNSMVTKHYDGLQSPHRHPATSRLWTFFRRTARLRTLLRNVNSWMCNVFTAAEVTRGHPLYITAYNLLHSHDVIANLRLDNAKLQHLLLRVESGYLANPYHNALHAADVVQTVHYFLVQPLFLPFIGPLQVFAALMAAAVHDYAHPGVNNAFEIASRSRLAVRYNDVSVLENMHVASFFELLGTEHLNVFASLPTDDFRRVRQLMIGLVLGTDMAKHFEDLSKFKARLAALSCDATPEAAAAVLNITHADTHHFLQMAVHTADVSNPAKPLKICKMWVTRVLEEFYAQGDQEKALGLPVSPFYDRSQPNPAKLQCNFIDFIVAPLFSEWAKIIPDIAQVVMPLLQANRRYWDMKCKAPIPAAPPQTVVVSFAADPSPPPAPHIAVPTRTLPPLMG